MFSFKVLKCCCHEARSASLEIVGRTYNSTAYTDKLVPMQIFSFIVIVIVIVIVIFSFILIILIILLITVCL